MKIGDRWIGYCTNVHAGADLPTTLDNLQHHAVRVRQILQPEASMGIGLWLSDRTAIDLISQNRVGAFRDWLDAQQLVPFTFNGFPYGNFHQPEVKKLVYLPTWADDARREYSERLVEIQHQLLPEGIPGSISTLPLGWKDETRNPDFLAECTSQLHELVEYLEDFEEKTGRLIHFCLEPEPGCLMQDSRSCVEFFQQYLLGQSSQQDERTLRYLRVCHDICHSAVMFEEQEEFVHNLISNGIRIGKVQVSSAVHARFADRSGEEKQQLLNELSRFHEPRYLHQTVIKNQSGEAEFHDDLPQALETIRNQLDDIAEARVHFHVPIFLRSFGSLGTSRTEILKCLAATQNLDDLVHYEVETYAWNVLPAELQPEELAEGIAREIRWLCEPESSEV